MLIAFLSYAWDRYIGWLVKIRSQLVDFFPRWILQMCIVFLSGSQGLSYAEKFNIQPWCAQIAAGRLCGGLFSACAGSAVLLPERIEFIILNVWW